MRTALWLAGCAVVLAVSSVAADDKDTIDPAKMVGTWKYVSGEKNGEKVDADRLKDQTVIITKDKITLKGEQTFVMKYTIDAKKKPAAIKMEMTESPFEAKNPEKFARDLAARINQLMKDPQLRERFGKAGRKCAEENFSWAAIAEKTKKLYETSKR